jgi:uncharacterized membrane protein YgcG
MKRMTIAAALLALSLVGSGCMSERYVNRERARYVEPDTLNMMTKDDVIALSTAKVSDQVIIDQIEITGTYFQLGTQDIIDLAKAGVSDKVISAMMKTDRPSQTSDEGYTYYYPPYYWYAGYPYWYPWYPSFYLGFSSRYYRPHYRSYVPHYGNIGHRGFYGGHGFSGGGRGSGSGRGGGRHR